MAFAARMFAVTMDMRFASFMIVQGRGTRAGQCRNWIFRGHTIQRTAPLFG
jgi:hypothetical protein